MLFVIVFISSFFCYPINEGNYDLVYAFVLFEFHSVFRDEENNGEKKFKCFNKSQL